MFKKILRLFRPTASYKRLSKRNNFGYLKVFEHISPEINISIIVYFTDKNELVMEGNDTGEAVAHIWGDTDYEYSYTIQPTSVKKISKLLNIPENDKQKILKAIKENFNGSDSFQKFGTFLKNNEIEHKFFNWNRVVS